MDNRIIPSKNQENFWDEWFHHRDDLTGEHGYGDAGIDVQVLSWSDGGEGVVSQEGITKARKHNDKFAEVIHRYPERFSGRSGWSG